MLSKCVVTRRCFIGGALQCVAGLTLGGTFLSALTHAGESAEAVEPYCGFRVGLQSYSLRKFGAEEAAAMIAELGLKYVEAFPAHLPARMDIVEDAKEVLKRHGLTLVAYGVVHLTKDEKAMRGLFEFAKAMGIEVLSADPDPDSFNLLDKLTEEYGVAVGIHNHGPGHRWNTIEVMRKAIEGHSTKVGICLDTGHLARAGDDIVKAVHVFKERLHGVHLKDVNEKKHDVIVGTGVLDIKGFFKALKEIGFKGYIALEYELEPDNPIPGIRKSLEFIQKVCSELA